MSNSEGPIMWVAISPPNSDNLCNAVIGVAFCHCPHATCLFLAFKRRQEIITDYGHHDNESIFDLSTRR